MVDYGSHLNATIEKLVPNGFILEGSVYVFAGAGSVK